MNKTFLPIFCAITFLISLFSCKSYERKQDELKTQIFEDFLKEKGYSNLKVVKQVATPDSSSYTFLKRKSEPLSVLEFDFNDDGYNEFISATINTKTNEYDIAVADIRNSTLFFASEDLGSANISEFCTNFNSLDWRTGNSLFDTYGNKCFSEGLFIRNIKNNNVFTVYYDFENKLSTSHFDEYTKREEIVKRILRNTGNENFQIIYQVKNNLDRLMYFADPDDYYPPSVLSVNLDGEGDDELICLLNDSVQKINMVAVFDVGNSRVHFAYDKLDNNNPLIYSLNHFPSKAMADWGVKVTAEVEYNTDSPLPCVVINFPHINNNFMVVSYLEGKYHFSYHTE